MLIALYLYATLESVNSARPFTLLCHEHLTSQYLCRHIHINHQTLTDFRVTHRAVLKPLLIHIFAALLQTHVTSLERLAQDDILVPRCPRRLFPPLRDPSRAPPPNRAAIERLLDESTLPVRQPAPVARERA